MYSKRTTLTLRTTPSATIQGDRQDTQWPSLIKCHPPQTSRILLQNPLWTLKSASRWLNAMPVRM
jgi:hypothetical protein